MSMLLEIKDLYGGYQEGVNILQGIDLTVAEGEAVGIIGLNGSGKSTLGKAIMNQIPYRQGSIFFNGQSVDGKTIHELAQLGIALMHQGGEVFPNLSVWQNLQLAMGNSQLSARSKTLATDRDARMLNSQLQEFIPLFRKPKKLLSRTMADKLSGGQCHELALAMTLARNPKLVILDEPSAGLSPKAMEKVYSMLSEIRKQFGITILLIEQNVAKAVGFCERCVMLRQGTIAHEFLGESMNVAIIEKLMFNK